DCWLGRHIKREGWWDWNKPAAHNCVQYAGAILHGPAGDTTGWVPWANELDVMAAAGYAREQVLAGGDGWDPEGGDGDAVETAELSANGRTVHIETYCEDEPALRARLKREGRSAALRARLLQILRHGRLRPGLVCTMFWAFRLWTASRLRFVSSAACGCRRHRAHPCDVAGRARCLDAVLPARAAVA
ncbi:MAG: hypothetical protein ACLU37_12810, partial [Collinsella sp.]